MQKAGCINNLEVKIESIDHQNVHIMTLNNIVIRAECRKRSRQLFTRSNQCFELNFIIILGFNAVCSN